MTSFLKLKVSKMAFDYGFRNESGFELIKLYKLEWHGSRETKEEFNQTRLVESRESSKRIPRISAALRQAWTKFEHFNNHTS